MCCVLVGGYVFSYKLKNKRQHFDRTNIPNAQPPLTPEDCITAEKIVQSSDKVKALLEERGITDIKMVVADPWSYG